MACAARRPRSALPICKHGARCYRKNPHHRRNFFHPGSEAPDKFDDSPSDSSSEGDDDSYCETDESSGSLSPCRYRDEESFCEMDESSRGLSPCKFGDEESFCEMDESSRHSPTCRYEDDESFCEIDESSEGLPPCRYGANCYRKNVIHFAEYWHPIKASPNDDCGGFNESDDSDEEQSCSDFTEKKLDKKYSMMTEDERKNLLMEAKDLKTELKKMKAEIKAKDNELRMMQKQAVGGLLLVDGEEKALKGKTTVYFTLKAERDYKERSAAQAHFRLAESQFYRLLSSIQGYKVTKVEYVVNPNLVPRFREAKEGLKRKRGEKLSNSVLAFHGTAAGNITPICENGFKVPGNKGFVHSTDEGCYGKGVYFSEYPSYSMGFIKGANKILLCQVLPGKVFHCKNLIQGAPLTKGYDSHMSPNGKELVIFNSHHILPSYIVHYSAIAGDFRYSGKDGKINAPLKPKLPPLFSMPFFKQLF